MPIQNLAPGTTLKFPLSLKFQCKNPAGNGEVSSGAEPIAVTIVDGSTTAEQIDFVPHAPGGINYIQSDGDVLSGMFTGCVMSAYQVAGKRRVAHVHTGTDAGADRCNKATMKALLNGASHRPLVSFKPYEDADNTKYVDICMKTALGPKGCAVFGLVTADQSCYAIFTQAMGTHEYKIVHVVDKSAQNYQFG